MKWLNPATDPGHVAQQHQLGAAGAAHLVRRVHRHAAGGHRPAQRAAQVELSAVRPATPRRQPRREAAGQGLHGATQVGELGGVRGEEVDLVGLGGGGGAGDLLAAALLGGAATDLLADDVAEAGDAVADLPAADLGDEVGVPLLAQPVEDPGEQGVRGQRVQRLVGRPVGLGRLPADALARGAGVPDRVDGGAGELAQGLLVAVTQQVGDDLAQRVDVDRAGALAGLVVDPRDVDVGGPGAQRGREPQVEQRVEGVALPGAAQQRRGEPFPQLVAVQQVEGAEHTGRVDGLPRADRDVVAAQCGDEVDEVPGQAVLRGERGGGRDRHPSIMRDARVISESRRPTRYCPYMRDAPVEPPSHDRSAGVHRGPTPRELPPRRRGRSAPAAE